MKLLQNTPLLVVQSHFDAQIRMRHTPQHITGCVDYYSATQTPTTRLDSTLKLNDYD